MLHHSKVNDSDYGGEMKNVSYSFGSNTHSHVHTYTHFGAYPLQMSAVKSGNQCGEVFCCAFI
ncbi:hypothetical protein QR98_0087610 [Sarcoptes scabiei]|uniref:Uncharacterized protein n=1 Tax=Sarcoptes scabiei TaxID=52283 RepID=A0A132AGU1_SARSC|nr:hypothetical protein QR98_0087610 [Sarcoptes scabiei]